MTKEGLERIKQAYKSGLKVQIWFNGYWENFNIRDYSMYSEPFSERRQYRIVGSAYADIAEKRIAELEKENAELKEKLEHRNCVDCSNHGSNIKLVKAKKIIKDLLPCASRHIFNDLPRLDEEIELYHKAEDFIKE